jgi:hypothetical protein
LPFVLYGCETLSLPLREVQDSEENIWTEERYKVTGDWRKLFNEELHNLHSSPNIIRMITSRRMGWTGYVTRKGAKRNACKIWRESQKE